jgi:hypothetical protein
MVRILLCVLTLFVASCTSRMQFSLRDDIEAIKEQQIELYKNNCVQILYFDALKNPAILEKPDVDLGIIYFKYFPESDRLIYVQQARNLIKNKDGN